MDNLPIELIHHIFRHLSVDDLITCRQVCRKFKFVVEERKVPELITCDRLYPWFFNNKPANLSTLVRLDRVLFISDELKLPENLRRLRVEFKGSKLVLEWINSLQQLEVLELLYRSEIYRRPIVELPNLRVLSAQNSGYQNTMCLQFKSPKLEKLHCAELDDIRIDDPLTVKQYVGEYYDESVRKFKNLESLHYQFVDDFDRDVLTHFTQLKELRLHWSDLEFDRQNQADVFVMDLAGHLMKQKLVQRRPDFRLYIQGVEIRDKNLFVDNIFENELDFQLRNYEQLDRVPCCVPLHIDYATVMKLKPEIPVDFFLKFACIQTVKVKQPVANGDQLIGFLKSAAGTLEALTLKNSQLTQEQINQLPHLTALIQLKIDEATELDYSFIMRMKALDTLKIKQPFAGAFALAMKKFKRSPTFEDFEWKLDEGWILVNRSRSDRTLFSLMWFHKQDSQTSFAIKLDRELITCDELAAIYQNQICKEGVITRRRSAMLSKPNEESGYISDERSQHSDYSDVSVSDESGLFDESELSEESELSDESSESESESSSESEEDD